jgi:D-alanyl-D-alanine carboxypeptidase/D-alanyl-D-alanine-endopeptidase (penicillin-binding protein 4)
MIRDKPSIGDSALDRRLANPAGRPRARLGLASALLALAVTWLAGAAATAAPGDALGKVLALPRASLLVEESGTTPIAHQADQPMVPASTMKLLTALAAIEHWGLPHRFHTDFLRAADGSLWVRGYGDPFLVSEELEQIAAALRARGVERVPGIGVDDGYFAEGVEIDGRSATDNPYDAPVSAVGANFNTVSVRVTGQGVGSAEAQTPLTPLARELASGLPRGEHRINLKERPLARRYFGEVLAAKLAEAGVSVGGRHRSGAVPAGAELLYRHQNSRSLREVIAAMLEYSNNFIANQVFLLLADDGRGGPVTVGAAQQRMHAWADQRFGWGNYRVEDGAGLSRGNRLSARQLLDVVKALAAYRDLLPAQNGVIRAKTGTLTGVSCYAGFVERRGAWVPFSLLINQPVAYNLRLEVAEALAGARDLASVCRGARC